MEKEELLSGLVDPHLELPRAILCAINAQPLMDSIFYKNKKIK